MVPLQVVRLRISLIHADLFAFRVAMSPATSQPPQKTSSQPQQEAAATSQSPQETAASATTTTTKPAEKEPASKVPRVVMVSVAAAGCLLRDWQVQLQSGLSMLGPNGQPARSWDPWVADCSHTPGLLIATWSSGVTHEATQQLCTPNLLPDTVDPYQSNSLGTLLLLIAHERCHSLYSRGAVQVFWHESQIVTAEGNMGGTLWGTIEPVTFPPGSFPAPVRFLAGSAQVWATPMPVIHRLDGEGVGEWHG